MALKVSVKQRGLREFVKELEKLERNIMDRKTAALAGRTTVREMKRLILGGFSPIQGPGIRRNFAPYKNPTRYPGSRKPHSPVNLKLTGEFLKDLTFNTKSVKSGYAPVIFYNSTDSQKKEQGHREGARGQPKRPTIPTRSGQSLRDNIVDELTEVVQDRLDEVTKKI